VLNVVFDVNVASEASAKLQLFRMHSIGNFLEDEKDDNKASVKK
jgi:hypothetical protein